MLPTDGSVDAAAGIAGRTRIAVLVPCYNEEAAIGKVVADFREALPDARIYVYDNNRIVEAAAKAGATVRRERHQGKGRVVRRMFTDIDANIYVLVDGDASASKLDTWRDGARILLTVLRLYRAERPLALFTGIGLSPSIVSIGLAILLFITYFVEGVVPRLPTAVPSTGLMLLAFLSVACGSILDTVTRGRRELEIRAYLAQRAPAEERRLR